MCIFNGEKVYCINPYEQKRLNEFEELNFKLHEVSSSSKRCQIFNQMKELYDDYKVIQYSYIFKDNRLTTERFYKFNERPSFLYNFGNVIFNEEAQNYEDGVNQVYLIRIYDENNELLWVKVGTTTKKTVKRMKQHLRYYENAEKIYVDRVYDCGEIEPEGLESELRAYYIKKHKGTFKKNDRFNGIEFNLEEADRIAMEYLKID